MLKEIKWDANMMLRNLLLKYIIIISGLKVKDSMIQ